MGRPAAPAAAVAVALIALITGCGQQPSSTSPQRTTIPTPLPAACLGAGLDLALAYGAYAVPLSGTTAYADELPDWDDAAAQAGPVARDDRFTLCAYVADHPSPFTTRGGADAVVCIAVDADGRADLLGARMAAAGDAAAACAPVGGS